MSSFNEYAPWADVQYTNLTPEEIKAAADAVRGGGGSTTSSATATKEPEAVRNQREKYIISSSDSQIATMLKQGIITMDEVQRLLPESRVAKVLDNQVTAAEMGQKFSIPKQDIDSFESPQNVLAGRSTVDGAPMGQGEPVSGAGGPASASATRPTTTSSSRPSVSSGGGTGGSGSPSASAASPAIAGNFVANNGRPYIEYQGQRYMLPAGVQEDDPRVVAALQRLGAGNTSGSVVANTKNDLYLRGGTDLGKAVVSRGQQYRASALVPEQGADGKWYIPGQQTPFPSESAAKAAIPLVNVGAGVTSRMGNSPLAQAAGQGGYSQMLDPNKALFPTIGMDQQIAAGATKGSQVGDILGTISNNGDNFYDITLGGISEGGGLTTVGNSMNPYDSFTGQMANSDSLGMGSILGNSGYNTLYWLQQSTGIPESVLAKYVKTPQDALAVQQAAETIRASGQPFNLASLRATNEPSGYEGAAGGSQLKWGSQNGGVANNPYRQAEAAFLEYALGEPDLTYLPDPMGYGSTQIGNTAYANSGVDEWGNPLYADGGQFWADEPIVGVGALTGRKRFMLGEEPNGMGGFKPERLTIEPQEDVMNGQSGYSPMGTKMRKFANGGTIYTPGAATGWTQQYEPEPSPFSGGGGYDGITQGNAVNPVRMPMVSASGQPVPASFGDMSPKQTQPFTTQGGAMPNQMISGALSAQPVGTQPYGSTVLPVYDQLNPKTYDNLPSEMGQVTGYRMVPYDLGGTPVLVRVPEYGNIPANRLNTPADRVAYWSQRAQSGDSQAMQMLYKLDPVAAMRLVVDQSQQQNNDRGNGGYGGRWGDRSVQNEADRTRFYDAWDTPNRNRADLPGATVLPIDRVQNWTGEGEAPYQRFGGQVEQGFRLPNDYEVGGPFYNRGNEGVNGGYGGRWGGGRTGYRKQRNWERRPMGAPLGAGVM